MKTIRFGGFEIAIHYYNGFFFLPIRAAPRLDCRNRFMFTEDFRIYVSSAARLDNDDDPIYRIEGDPVAVKQAEQYISTISSFTRGHRRRGVVGKYVKHLAEHMAWSGRMLIDVSEVTDVGPNRPRLRECPSDRVIQFANRFIQFGASSQHKRIDLHIGVLHKRNVLNVSIPASLGGHRGYRKMLRELDRFDLLGPKFFMDNIAEMQAKWAPFQEMYRIRASAYRSYAARDWGWNGRDMTLRFSTEYFTVNRHIRMLRACALVREEIMTLLQQYLAERGLHVQITCRLKSSESIEATLCKLHRGDISLTEAFNRVRIV